MLSKDEYEKQLKEAYLCQNDGSNPICGYECCLPLFLQEFSTQTPIEIIEIEAGEEFKNIETCVQVWYAMSELEADRKSLLINLGGGVVTDLGGFVASTYMASARRRWPKSLPSVSMRPFTRSVRSVRE